LAYDELLAHQIALVWRRNLNRHAKGRALIGDESLRAAALARFGHQLTPSQNQALAEIDGDLAAPRQMRRLLQGDVGSGKTLVALMAMLRAVESGHQAVLMAPTEVLAQQHYKLFSKLAGVPVGLLTGSVKGKARRELLARVEAGDLPILIGTHALFQDGVNFRDLALVVIDEQHRFGVEQRLALGAKGEQADMLAMTATPIPRSLLLTRWGEMEVSRIPEKPVGRKRIITTTPGLSRLADVVEGLARQIAEGGRVYWVCPLVAENVELDLAAAEERFERLRERFGALVGLAHGQMEGADRDRALADFAAGRTRILVATTVIEVGVDVPEATIMVVEHAERFGLAQLHQLRGRVGRGGEQSYCLLLHAEEIGKAAKARLGFLRDCDDGFRIADEDFRIRGPGELLGTKQSGDVPYRLAGEEHLETLLPMARKDAEYILEPDSKLEGPRGEALRLLLGIFERRAALMTLRAG
jgi:ATP-dependent DNA helicase RecG